MKWFVMCRRGGRGGLTLPWTDRHGGIRFFDTKEEADAFARQWNQTRDDCAYWVAEWETHIERVVAVP